MAAHAETLILTGGANLKGICNAGRNPLFGNAGDTRLNGGPGAYVLTGVDVFVFRDIEQGGGSAVSRDRITDLDATKGDLGGLRGMDSGQNRTGTQSFDLMATTGKVRVVPRDDRTIVRLDTEGDRVADVPILAVSSRAVIEDMFLL